MRTELTAQYGCEFPFVQAGLAFVGATPALAVAVCRGGGVGGLGVGIMPAQAVRHLIRTVRAATAAPFHVNFITFLARREQIDTCIEERVPIVSK